MRGAEKTLLAAIKLGLMLLIFIPSVEDQDPDPLDPHVLGLLDPDPLVRGMDLDPDPAIIMQKEKS